MGKGRHIIKRKTSCNQDSHENQKISAHDDDDDDDEELQIKIIKTIPNISSTESADAIMDASIPSVAKIMKDCDGSISTALTSNETDTSSPIVGSTLHLGTEEGEKNLHQNIQLKFSKRFANSKQINH